MYHYSFSRRQVLFGLGAMGLARAANAKPMRGIFVIMATPFTESKDVDYEDLAREVDFMDRCGVHGTVWPQLASEYASLTQPERMKGMEVLAKASQGKKAALVFGVQGPNLDKAMEYLQHAESLAPDALIAIPPTEAKSVDDFRRYYAGLAAATKRPFFVQTTGGAKGITPPVEMMTALAKEFPHLGHIKEESDPVIERMIGLSAHRPAVKSVFSGAAGKGMMYEMRLGMDGTMPGAPFSDVYVQIWDAYQSGNRDKAREIFSKLLLMVNLDQVIPGTRQYIMRKRGVFKTMMSRRQTFKITPAAAEEIEFQFAGLKPYLRA
ncbi:MAG: dihydrodipicolinate synthase family protein [Acidobacteriia bacterium]|nr:dihydrodipicolinate synthase family protein [Terriglobia bacterium]